MKTVKFKLLLCSCISVACTLSAQTIKETAQPLTKQAHKGFLDDVTFADGNINVLYKIGGDKKKNELFYENYSFDKDLKFIETKSANQPKEESKPNREMKYLSAFVGGKTSFDVLSMKLKVRLMNVSQKWDYKRQAYVRDEVISNDVIKLKDENGHSYYGVAELDNEDSNDIVVLAYYETKDKKNPKQYVLLTISHDGNIIEKNIDATGSYAMTFCQSISDDAQGAVEKNDFIVVLAPNRQSPDLSKYVYLHYGIKGNLKSKVEFNSPATSMLVNSIDVKNGEVYLLGLSKKGTKAYEDVFEEYATIESPAYSSNVNYQKDKYDKAANNEMDNFHLLKFSGNKMVFATSASVSEFKSKKKIAPGEKSGKVYNGKKFYVSNFEVTPAHEYLIAGQITSRVNIGDLKNPDFRTAYGDVVCFHFDTNGNLKAEYAIDKIYEDKKSEIFDMPQKFYTSADGKTTYWEIMEVKGYSGYNSFADAYNGRKTFRPRYFPRITKIDLTAASLSEFKTPGQQKYFVYNSGIFFNDKTSTATFVGRDEDHENLWISQVTFD
ncbi:MAG: hypothetical protein JST48_13545 [Bacteroidetes bacterium]|nr:hypothetical protein [Bacteroidota bacterium]